MEDNTQAVQALSKKDEAYVRIKDRIISGEYKPGSLLVERTLSDSLDMSRTPYAPPLWTCATRALPPLSPARASMYLSSDAGTLRKYMKSVPFLIRLFSCPS